MESISPKVQNQIIVQRLFESGYDAKDIIGLEIEGLNRSTIYNQVSKLTLGEEIGYKRRSSYARKLDDENVMYILDYIDENPNASCSDIKNHINTKVGTSVSIETVRLLLQELGFQYKEPKTTFFLSNDHKISRLNWAQEHLNKDWKKVIFSDETTFWLGRSGIARWKPLEEKNFHMVSKNVPKVHVWGAISWNGKVSIVTFRENLTSPFYVSILSDRLEEMKNLYRYTSGWSYQQDNDPKHTANITKEWFRENKVKTLSWPAASPDLNPIENLWGKMKKEIAKKKPGSLQELEEGLISLWEAISLDYIQAIIESMNKRCKEVLNNKGNRIYY